MHAGPLRIRRCVMNQKKVSVKKEKKGVGQWYFHISAGKGVGPICG
jgi:hypothetical protein